MDAFTIRTRDNISDIATPFDLQNIVTFPTRQSAHLEKIFTNIENIQKLTPERLAPRQDSDHDMVFIPRTINTVNDSGNIPYRKVTRESKLAVELDIAALDWSNICSLPDPNTKAHALQTTITNIVNKHCPIRYRKATKPKTPWFGSLANKLRNAKNKSLRRGAKTSSFFSNALKKHLRKAKRKWIADRLGQNNSKITWRMVKTLTAKTKKTPAKP